MRKIHYIVEFVNPESKPVVVYAASEEAVRKAIANVYGAKISRIHEDVMYIEMN